MTETCWFWKKRLGDLTKSIEIPIIKILDSHETRSQAGIGPFVTNNIKVTTTYRYLEEKMVVPRCSTCAQLHNNAKMIKVAGIILPFLLVALSFLVSFLFPVDSEMRGFTSFVSICGFFALPIFLLVGMLAGTEYLRRNGALPLADRRNYPPLLARQAEGWQVVKK